MRDENDLLQTGELPTDPEDQGNVVDLHGRPIRVKDMPVDDHAERGACGVLLRANGEGVADSGLLPEHFGDQGWRAVFTTMADLRRADRPSDPPAVVAAMQRQYPRELAGLVDSDGYRAARVVFRAASDAPAPEVAAAYRDRVISMAIRREMVLHAERLAEMARSPAVPMADVAREWDTAGERLRARPGADRGFRLVGDVAREVVEQAWERAYGATVGVFSTGFPALDAQLDGGLSVGDLAIIGGRPGMGKTAFALSMSRKAARKGTGVLVLSLELMASIAVRRVLAQESRLSTTLLKTGKHADGDPMNRREYERAMESAANLYGDRFYIGDKPALGLADVRSAIRTVKRECPELGIVIVDYIQIMSFTGRGSASTSNLVGDAAQRLRDMGKEEGVSIGALSQLNRATEDNLDKKPTPANLRDSGGLEAAASIILFPWRRGILNPNDPTIQEEAAIIVAKATDGKTGEVPFKWHAAYQEFADEEITWARNAQGNRPRVSGGNPFAPAEDDDVKW